MPTKKNKKNYTKYIRPKISAHEIEAYLIDLEKATDEETEFWEEYWQFFSREREKRLDDIIDSLHEAKLEEGIFEKCSRIVSAEFSDDPICTAGSTKVFSNRFNFGNISTSLKPFQALYVAENFNTAYLEKYGYEYGTFLGRESYDPSILRAQPGGFSHCELNLRLESYIDIRKIDSLQTFVNTIKDIHVSPNLISKARRLFGRGKFTTINSPVSLKRALMFRDHAQWPTLLSQPSNSQWFGHYVKEAGISGIVYPSIKSRYGFNIVLFADNLSNSNSYARLTQNWPTIPSDRHFLDATNCDLMQFKTPAAIVN